MDITSRIDFLVKKLPTVYQPIFGFPQYDKIPAGNCQDQLNLVAKVAEQLRSTLGRPLRILDLGCAQGFFSLHLAALGDEVVGIDPCSENILLCETIAHAYSLKSTFITADLISGLTQISEPQFDLMLGFNIFHHLCREKGFETSREWLSTLSQQVTISLIETILREEPQSKASSLPENPRDLLSGFSYIEKISEHSTDLSKMKCPIYFASNTYWYANGRLTSFDSWKDRSHELIGNHGGTRRYYFTDNQVLKYYSFSRKNDKSNPREMGREISFLNKFSADNNQLPRMLDYQINEHDAWLLREKVSGTMLCDMIVSKISYDATAVIDSVLEQLAHLEQQGYYHRDMRSWNILIDDDGKISVIDYGAIDTTPRNFTDPNNIYLAFMGFCYEVINQKVLTARNFHPIHINKKHYPEKYHTWLDQITAIKPKHWNFSVFLQLFRKQHNVTTKPTKRQAFHSWLNKMESNIENKRFKLKHFEIYFLWKMNYFSRFSFV